MPGVKGVLMVDMYVALKSGSSLIVDVQPLVIMYANLHSVLNNRKFLMDVNNLYIFTYN